MNPEDTSGRGDDTMSIMSPARPSEFQEVENWGDRLYSADQAHIQDSVNGDYSFDSNAFCEILIQPKVSSL